MAKPKKRAKDDAFEAARAGNANLRHAEKIADEYQQNRASAAASQVAREQLIASFPFTGTHGGNSASDLGRAGRRGFDPTSVSYRSFMAYGELIAAPLAVSIACAGQTRPVYFGGGTIALEEKIEAFSRWFTSLTPYTKYAITFPDSFTAPDPLPKSYDTLWVAQDFWMSSQASLMWSLEPEVTTLFLSSYKAAALEVKCRRCSSHEVIYDIQDIHSESGITFRERCGRCQDQNLWHASTR